MGSNLCRRCGTCCRKGGPALHLEDLPLLEHIPMSGIVCLRRGEPAHDPRTDSLAPLPQELLKIRGKERSWECVYYQPRTSACTVYGHRPLECRALACTDTHDILGAMGKPVLRRADVVSPASALGQCIEEHERLFPVHRALDLAGWPGPVSSAGNGELERLLLGEMHYRLTLAERVQGRDSDLWAYLGRPLWLVLLPLDPGFSRFEILK